MRYFKYIDIDNYQAVAHNSRAFVSEIYSKQIRDQKSIFQQIPWKIYLKYCPEILTAFSKYDLEPTSAFIYLIYNQAQAPLHIDTLSNTSNKCRVNIPIFNCEYSRTEFYTYKDRDLLLNTIWNQRAYGGYIELDETDVNVEKVDEVVVDRPTILRVQEIHRVLVDNINIPRTVLSFRTIKDPVYLLEEEDANC